MNNENELKDLLNEGEALLNYIEPTNSMIIDAPRLDSRKTHEWKLKTLICLKNTIGVEDDLYIEFENNVQTNYKHEIEIAVSTLNVIIENLGTNNIQKNDIYHQDTIETILNGFFKVVLKLKELNIEIKTEEDVKKLLNALLGIYYENIKTEEHVPSSAGVASRIDLYINDIDYGIEIKFARNSIQQKQIVEQINDDIQKYQKLKKCKRIYFFIYNPDFLIENPESLKELPSKAGDIKITTIVNPTP